MRSLTRDLKCQEVVELVTDYLEGRLSWRQRRRFEKHLAGCPNCSTYLDQIRASVEATGRVEVETLDPVAQDELIELFRRYTGTPDDT